MVTEDLWVVVDAGGEPTHLAPTVELVATITHLDRVLVVVSAAHAAIAHDQIARYPGVELVVQPRDLGTAPASLLGIARVLERDPLGRVVLLPANHQISNPGPLVDAIRTSELGRVRPRVTLIGMTPAAGNDAHSWIVWNTSITIGQVTTFWDLARAHLPDHTALLEHYIDAIGSVHEGVALQDAYTRMTAASFGLDVLAKAQGLVAIPASVGGSESASSREIAHVHQSRHSTRPPAAPVERSQHATR